MKLRIRVRLGFREGGERRRGRWSSGEKWSIGILAVKWAWVVRFWNLGISLLTGGEFAFELSFTYLKDNYHNILNLCPFCGITLFFSFWCKTPSIIQVLRKTPCCPHLLSSMLKWNEFWRLKLIKTLSTFLFKHLNTQEIIKNKNFLSRFHFGIWNGRNLKLIYNGNWICLKW